MSVTLNDLEKIAQLARLTLKEDEKEKFLEQVNQILKYVEKLNEVNTEGVEPLSHSMDLVNVMREDEIKPSMPVEKGLANAPDREGTAFKVPRIIED